MGSGPGRNWTDDLVCSTEIKQTPVWSSFLPAAHSCDKTNSLSQLSYRPTNFCAIHFNGWQRLQDSNPRSRDRSTRCLNHLAKPLLTLKRTRKFGAGDRIRTCDLHLLGLRHRAALPPSYTRPNLCDSLNHFRVSKYFAYPNFFTQLNILANFTNWMQTD